MPFWVTIYGFDLNTYIPFLVVKISVLSTIFTQSLEKLSGDEKKQDIFDRTKIGKFE